MDARMCRSLTPKCNRRLRVKDLSNVPTWPPKRDSNPRPFTQKVSNLQMSHCPIILSLQCFHSSVICLFRNCSVQGFDCLFLCFLRHYTISSRFPWFHYLFLLCSMLRLSLPLFITLSYLINHL